MAVSPKRVREQSGFSLVSVTMAASILGIISVAISQLVISQSQSVSYLEDRLAKVDLKNNLISLLSNPTACINTFGTMPVSTSQNVSSISNANNDIEFNLNNRNSYDHLSINNFRLENVDVPAAPGSTGRMKMVVNVSRQRKGGGGDTLSPVEVNLSVTTDGTTGEIASCGALGGDGSFDIADIMDQINEARKCEGAPPGPNYGYVRIPANAGATFDEGHVYTYPGDSSCIGPTSYLCVNGSWSKFSECTVDRGH